MLIAKMYFWFVLLLFGCVLLNVNSRPQQADYNNDSDNDETDEDEDADPAADMYSAEEPRLNEQETVAQEDEAPRSRHLMNLPENRYLQRNAPDDNPARAKLDDLSDTRAMRDQDLTDESPESINFNGKSRSYQKRRQTNKYNDALDEQQEIQHLASSDIVKPSHIQNDDQVNKRPVGFDATVNEEGDMIFEKSNREQVRHNNKNEYNGNEASDSEQQRYFKQYYNTMQAENRDMGDGKTHDGARYNLRDRREIKSSNQPENTGQNDKEPIPKRDNEDEESAIKRHIKKLSGEELEQLLNSLTEEKRELLKKIIDETDSSANVYVNKREITKKAGAVEEMNYIENCQSDLSKMHGGSSSVDVNSESASSQSSDATDSSSKQQQDIQTDNPDLGAKSSEANLVSVTNVELNNQNDDAGQKKSDNSLNTFSLNAEHSNQAGVIANEVVTSKTENKREVKLEDLEEADDILDDSKLLGQDYANDEGYLNSQDESLANVVDDDHQQREEKAFKREASYDKKAELSDSFRSLEESFPNSNAYDDSASYSGPLIRVKRKNYDPIVNKRSAGPTSDTKVAYFPYKAEIEEEDIDEGSEFEDEAFYDRTSNFANGNRGPSDLSQNSENSIHLKKSADRSKDKVDSDTMSLGSDTDSVLSGMEGVDDNLMYSSGTRKRRTPEYKPSVQSSIDSSLIAREGSVKSPAANYVNVPHYQENDAFGSLPRSYDGDLNRYKRIRRVKQIQPAAEEQNNSSGI